MKWVGHIILQENNQMELTQALRNYAVDKFVAIATMVHARKGSRFSGFLTNP
jgi:hypothetical protein